MTGDWVFRRWTLALLLAVGVVVAYAPVARHPFVLSDDRVYVTENPHVAAGLTASGVAWSLTAFHANNWHPLTWVSHMIDVQLYGLRAGGHHVTNVLLHLASALLLLLVLHRMTGQLGPSAFTAFLFALHPMHVESVAWAAERKDVLSGFFFVVVLGAWTLYAERPTPSRYAGALVAFTLGLLSKPMLVTTPFVLLLLDYWPLGRWPRPGAEAGRARAAQLLLEKAPMIALAAAASVLTVWAQGDAVAPLTRLPLGARVENAVLSYGRYLRKALWPTDLAFFYPVPDPLPVFGLALALAVLLIASVAAWVLRRRRPYVLVGWLWFVGMLVPVIGLVQVGWQSMADRYMYLPLIGLGIIVSWGARDLAASRPWGGRVAATAAVLAVLVFAAVTRKQLGFWSSTERLFQRALDVTGGNFDIEMVVGNELYGRQEYEGAARRFTDALSRVPGHPLALYNLGMARLQLGQASEAAQSFAAAARAEPASPEVHANLCLALDGAGRSAEAAGACTEALRLDASNPAALNALAWIRATSADDLVRNGAEAVRLARQAAAAPGGADERAVLDTLAAACAEAGRFEEAVAAEERAIDAARAAGDEVAARTYEGRLALYREGQPYRRSAPPAASPAPR